MSTQQNNGIFSGLFGALVFAFGIGMLFQFIGCGVENSVSSTPDRSSFEHRYATERFKQEGFSGSDAQRAADAVIRFHEAQKNRKR